MAIDKYVDLITSQHKTRPKFTAWISSPLTIISDNIATTNQIPSSFDIDTAIGAQLDTIGHIVGRSRTLSFQPSGGSSPVMDDPHYRLALKAKIAQNQWDGTIPQVYEVWNSLFPDVGLVIIDNQDMTISALVDGELDSISTELVASGYIIPKPIGVKLTIIEITRIAGNSYEGMLVNESDSTTLTFKTKTWSSLSGTWNDIPDGTTWINL
jgi:hypothetical protein